MVAKDPWKKFLGVFCWLSLQAQHLALNTYMPKSFGEALLEFLSKKLTDESFDDVESVDSSAIDSLGYNEDDREMLVVFTSGSSYIYYDVSPKRFANFLNATSTGKYFNARVKDNYSYSRES
jgi:lysyl-tRNA synthetase class 2